ncbi:MAG TPA: hypothetical protein ENN87_06720 [Phycisphaerales bacterium]|nr:hypothetical protein [Phycisphaerales bacterium]
MTALSNEEFAKAVDEIAAQTRGGRPVAYYDKDGDCIEFLATHANFWAERIDDLVTVYYDEQTDEVIGSLLKGVSTFIKKHPNCAICVEAGKVRLAHLFIAGGMLTEQAEKNKEFVVQIYRKLVRKAEETKAEAEIAGVC